MIKKKLPEDLEKTPHTIMERTPQPTTPVEADSQMSNPYPTPKGWYQNYWDGSSVG